MSHERLHLIDAIRGFSIISMVGFHLCYDLVYISGVPLEWFRPPLQDIWRASISWVFLLLAGCMCALSRNNLKRSLRYGAVAVAIFLVTSIAGVDTPISFGILYCMAASTFVVWLLEQAGLKPKGLVCACVLFVLFLLFLDVGSGRIGIGPLCVAVPRWLFDSGLFSWLGMPEPGFMSGDYYPLLPYTLLYLCGCALGSLAAQRGFPSFFYELSCPPLEAIGRHPLALYLAHQPVLLCLSTLVLRLAH